MQSARSRSEFGAIFPVKLPEPSRALVARRTAPRLRTLAVGAAALATLALWGPGQAAASGFGDPLRGQTIFQTRGCVRCHAVRGAGGRIGPDLGRREIGDSYLDIIAEMWNHSPAMREKMKEYHLSHPQFEGSELRDLVSFLYFLKYFDEPGDPRAGHALFSSKGCDRCHRVGSLGGSEGPALDAYPRNASPLRIVQDLWNHGPAMVSHLRRQGISPPVFEGTESLDLFAFLRSQGRRERSREFSAPGDPDRGEKLFRSKGCSRCHAVFGEGSTFARDLGESNLRGSATQVAARMWNHWSLMTAAMKSLAVPYPRFEGEELADLLAYIFVSRYNGVQGDAVHGAKLFVERGCASCHGREGEGDVGPALREVTPGRPVEDIVQRMWNHAPHMLDEGMERRIPWPRMDAREIADLVEFLSSAWPEAAEGPVSGARDEKTGGGR